MENGIESDAKFDSTKTILTDDVERMQMIGKTFWNISVKKLIFEIWTEFLL